MPPEPAEAAEHTMPLRRLLPVAIVVSCVLHAAAAAAVLVSAMTLSEYGVLQNETDASSLETTQTFVLESTLSEPVETAAAAAMPLGSVEQVDQQKEVEEVAVEEAAAPTAVRTANIDPDAVDATEEPLEVLQGSGEPAEALPEKAVEPKPDAKPEERKKKKSEESKAERSRRQTAGGPTSRANASNGATSGRASASRGSVLSYAARVRAKVAGNKPGGRGHRGTARVSFGVSSSGGLAFAHLSRSSGNSALDQAALSAVRRAAPFGPPPAGTSAAQLRFSIPFYFR
jgi:protein TonB